MLALRDSVVPVLNASALVEDHVVIIRDIACRVDIRMAGLEILIDQNAIANRQSAAGDNFGRRLHANSRDHKIALELVSSFEYGGFDGTIATRISAAQFRNS